MPAVVFKRVEREDGTQYAELGRSGLRVCRLCLGTMSFAGDTDEATSFAMMGRPLGLGFDFFDTANYYGGQARHGPNEEIIGRWLSQGNRRERFVLANKLYTPEDTLKHLDEIFPGLGGEAPMAYAW